MEVGVREEGGNRGSGVGGREDREPVSWRNFMDTEGSVWVVRKTRGIFMTTCNGWEEPGSRLNFLRMQICIFILFFALFEWNLGDCKGRKGGKEGNEEDGDGEVSPIPPPQSRVLGTQRFFLIFFPLSRTQTIKIMVFLLSTGNTTL